MEKMPRSQENIPHLSPMADVAREIFADHELADFFEKYSEQGLHPDGTSFIVQNPFELAAQIAEIDEEKAHRYVDALADAGFLSQLFYDHESVGITNEELQHELNLHQFSSIRENFTKDEMSVLDTHIVQCGAEYVSEIRKRFNLPPLTGVEHILQVHTTPFDYKDDGFGVVTPLEPFIYVSAPDHASSLKIAFHELMHVFGRNLCRFEKNAEGDITARFTEIGLSQSNAYDESGKPIRLLSSLNEAVTEEFVKRHTASLAATNTDLAKIDTEQRIKIAQYRESHPAELSDNEWGEVVAIHSLPDGSEYPAFFTYREERTMLNNMLGEMVKRLGAQADTGEPVSEDMLFDMLVAAQFKGDSTPFEILFDKSFGHGAFEEYKNGRTREKESGILTELGVPGLVGLFQSTPQ